ncbi:MAG: helix-turn-helix domain-containing protein [Phycisphaerae bacterium]
MAKPFYTMEEVCSALGKDADAIKKMVRDGALREFRDAGKVFFKAEDVDKLTKPGGGASSDTAGITLEPVEDELPTIADSGGTSIIGLEAVDDRGGKKKDDTSVPAGGIGVFEDEEVELDADPMAKTQITTGASDAVSLEGTGSGSGLLDLTREADDTSLGAELLDEIYPGEEEAAAPPPRAAAPVAAAAAEPEIEEETEAGEVVTPVYVTVGDPSEGLFSGLMISSLVVLAIAGTVVAGVLQGFMPSYARLLSSNFLLFVGGVLLLAIIITLIGWVVGRQGATRRTA